MGNEIISQFSSMIYRSQYEYNRRLLANFSMIHYNDGIHDTSVDIHLKLLVPITNVFILYELRYPDSKDDNQYGVSAFRSSINVAKLYDGISGNFVIAYLWKQIVESLDFEMKFPLKSVQYYILQLFFYNNTEHVYYPFSGHL
jgi:hypothetical protein